GAGGRRPPEGALARPVDRGPQPRVVAGLVDAAAGERGEQVLGGRGRGQGAGDGLRDRGLGLVTGEVHVECPYSGAGGEGGRAAQSRGRPRIRSPTTLSNTCSVPPAIDRHRTMRNLRPCSVNSTPPVPVSSRPNSAMS